MKCLTSRCATVIGVLALLASPSVAQSTLRAYYDDDFILATEDGAFELRIRGNVHFDARLYQSESRGAPHSMDLRRARIDLQGRIHDRFTFRLQPELVGAPYIRNAWVDVEFVPALHLRVGQMKVPFSTSWATLDNNVNFIERGAAPPTHPFFDVGAVLWGDAWGGLLTYNLGLFNGAGTDLESPSGDADDHKELVGRLFVQPFRTSTSGGLQGIYLVLEGTWSNMSQATTLETKGYRSANFESAFWRWRTEQVIGSDGRVTDRLAGQIDSRRRLGAELHYLRGPFAVSSEYLETRYQGVALFHDFYVGSARRVHEAIQQQDGTVRSWSAWASLYLTGESKRLTNMGWRTAKPRTAAGVDGPGGWEVLARYSRTRTSRNLFASAVVPGYEPGSESLPPGYSGSTPGAGNTVTGAVLDGAHEVHEVTLGLNWTVNSMVRVQLNDVFLWAPFGDRNGDGADDNLLVSGARSEQNDPDRKNIKTGWENAVMLRLIFKF